MIFNKKLFGKTLRLHRRINEHTLGDVNKQTGISAPTLQRIETANTNPNLESIMILCHNYLKVSIDTFTTQNPSCAPEVLNNKPVQVFASISQHLTLEELTTVALMLKRFERVSTLFDVIQKYKIQPTNKVVENMKELL